VICKVDGGACRAGGAAGVGGGAVRSFMAQAFP
jgi:hypothetical protein